MNTLTAEQMEALRRLDGCTLANAIEKFQTRLRNEGFTNNSLHCLFPHLPPIVGNAITIKIRGSQPPTAGLPYLEQTDWLDYVVSVPAPRIVVVQDVATRPGLASLLGAIHINILKALGCVGAVTNGAVRDISGIERLGFQLFASGLSVSHAYVHIVEMGTPVEIGGLKIQSGDLLHGDLHGIQSIPENIAAEIPPVAAEITAKEKALIKFCQMPGFSIEKLRAAFKANRS